MMKNIIQILMAIDFFYIIGLDGLLENDCITSNQFIVRFIIAFAIFLLLDYIKSSKKKPLVAATTKRLIANKISSK